MRKCEQALAKHFNPSLLTLQIGGADGVTHDPVHKLYTRESPAIIYEPVLAAFNTLNETYAAYSNILTVNAAIHYYNGVVRLYHDPQRCQLTSFYKDRNDLTKSDRVRWIHVRCQYPDFKDYNQLIVDAEGHDGEIINMCLLWHRPRLIFFEHTLMPATEYADLANRLRNNNYKLIESDQNELWMMR